MKFFKQPSAVAATESPLAWPLPFAALAVSLWASVVFWIVLVGAFSFVWIATPNNSGTFGGALAAATASFIHAHFVPLEFELFTLSIYPLFLSALLIWLIQAATKWAIRSVIFYHPASVLGLIGGVGLVHGFLLFVLSLLLNNLVNTTIAIVSGFGIGLLGAAIAVFRSANEPILEIPKNRFEVGERTKSWLKPQSPYLLVRDLLLLTPEFVRLGFQTALSLLKALTAWAAVLFLITIGFRFTSVLELLNLIAEDNSSMLAASVWSLLYLPVVFLWQFFLALGVELQLGIGSGFSLFAQSVAPLPVVPVLGFVPAQLPSWSGFLMAGTVFASLLGTRKLFAGHLRAKFDLRHASLVSSAVVGFFLLFTLGLNLFATGAIGAGRFGFVGFPWLLVLLHSVCLVTFSLSVRVLIWWLTARRSQMSEVAE